MLQPIEEPQAGTPETGAEIAALREMPLAELIANHPDASNKLRNVIANCVRMGALPCATLGDYLDLGPYAATLFTQRIWSFGQRSARELDAIVAKIVSGEPWCLESDLNYDVPADTREGTLSAAAMSTALGGLTLAQVTKDALISTRLTNVLRQPEVGNMEIAEFLAPDGTGRAYLLRVPNCGQRTFNELDRLCRQHALRILSGRVVGPTECSSDRERMMSALARTNHPSAVLAIEEPQAPEGADAEGLLRWGFQSLKEREIDVLTCRFGLADEPPQTLEQVGTRLGVTRERVRQIEFKALRKLHRLLRSKLPSALDQAADTFWASFDGDFVPFPAGFEFRRLLPPFVRLALEVAGSDSAAWIKSHGEPASFGILRPGTNLDELTRLADQLRRGAETSALPVALANLAPGVDIGALELAARAETRFCIVDGYLFEQKPRVRLKRAVRTHAILAAAKQAVSLQELGDHYRRCATNDPCSLRDLVIVMEALPHLFIELEEGVWAALGAGAAEPTESNCASALQSESEVDPQTLAGAIRLALYERGPTSLGDLYRDGDNIVPAGRSRISIGPIILGRPDLFLRILPGVYSLHDKVPSAADVCSAPLPYLLNPYQARVYAFARRAGEPWGTFPLWTAEAEYRLCLWARFEADSAIFHSLLKIASIEDWPVHDSVKQEWVRLAAQRARFELAPPRSIRGEPRPPLDRLLAAAIAVRDGGSGNWLLFNRIMGRRIDSVGGRGLLGLMLALGAVEAPASDNIEDEWQLPHPATERAAHLVDELSAIMIRSGCLSWESAIGDHIAARARGADEVGLGWATSATVEELLSARADTGPALADENEDEEGLFERLMHEHRRASEHQKRETIAQMLLVD